MTVYKYPLEVADFQNIILPSGAELLCCQVQAEKPCIWARVNPDGRKVRRAIHVIGTGHDAADCGPYVGTFQLHGGALVFHVFDGGEEVQA